MKVYIVLDHIDYEGDEIKAVFATREAAEAYADSLIDPDYWAINYYVKEFDVREDEDAERAQAED